MPDLARGYCKLFLQQSSQSSQVRAGGAVKGDGCVFTLDRVNLESSPAGDLCHLTDGALQGKHRTLGAFLAACAGREELCLGIT